MGHSKMPLTKGSDTNIPSHNPVYLEKGLGLWENYYFFTWHDVTRSHCMYFSAFIFEGGGTEDVF